MTIFDHFPKTPIDIVAPDGTLRCSTTGSIGVFGGKFVLADALGRFGVDMRGLSVGGDYADAFSPTQGFDQGQRAAFAASMDRIYEEFVARVAKGRKLPACCCWARRKAPR